MPSIGEVMRGRVATFVVLALLVPCSACSSLLTGSREDDIAALLEARSEALLAGDRAAFVRLLDPRDTAFVATEKRTFDNLQDLPVQRLAYRLDSTFHDQTSGRDVWKVEGREDLRLEDFDEVSSTSTTAFTVTELGGRMVFTAPVEEAAYDDRSQPWDLTRIHVDRTEHALLVYEDDTASLVGEGVAEVERAVREVDRAFPLDWDGHVVVYLLDDPEVLEPLDLVSSPTEPGGFAGATIPVLSDDVVPRVVGTRVVLSPAAYDVDRSARARLLRHELTHEAMGFGIGDDAWFAEGVATYVEYASEPLRRWPVARRDVARAGRGVSEMPMAHEMYEAGPEASAFSYALALVACDLIVRRDGREALADIYAGLAELGPDAMSGAQDAVYRQVTGLGSAALARQAGRAMVETFGAS